MHEANLAVQPSMAKRHLYEGNETISFIEVDDGDRYQLKMGEYENRNPCNYDRRIPIMK